MRERAMEELKDGTHPFLNPENRKKTLESINQQLKEKTHPFNRSTRTDPNKTLIYCNKCERSIPKPAFNRFHKYHNTEEK
jgi:hypothetical protein